ncbi:MAG TPA: hypothetical protein VE173_16345 [Longimicrobiales bacterium]|nr:hypothetical protein [Longimicrobiales bacterium]
MRAPPADPGDAHSRLLPEVARVVRGIHPRPPVFRSAVLPTALALACTPVRTAGQLPSADAAELGLGGSSPSLARGFAAVAANPAALGAPDGPAFSATLLSLGVRQGLDPVGLGELADWEDRDLPRSVREEWLERVRSNGSESGGAGAEVTLAALSRGRVGLQLSTRAFGRVSLNADAAELLLFGNAGLTGEPRDFDLAGSRGDGFVVTTAAVAWGSGVGPFAGGRLRVGATLSLSMGHVVALARDNGSGLTGDPTELDLRFPVLHVGGATGSLDHGHGVGLDLGTLWTDGSRTVGIVVRNVVNTFEWRVEDLVFRPGSALFDPEESSTDFDERPAGEAPPVLLDALEDMSFRPAVAAGASWRARPDLVIEADLELRRGGGMSVEPDARLGVGAEYRPRPEVPLRGDLAVVERGIQGALGAGLELGSFMVAGAVAVRTGALDDMLLGTFGVSFRKW